MLVEICPLAHAQYHYIAWTCLSGGLLYGAVGMSYFREFCDKIAKLPTNIQFAHQMHGKY